MEELEISKNLTSQKIKHDSEYFDYVQNRIHFNEYLNDNKMQEDTFKASREYAKQALVDKYGFETGQEVHVEQRELSWKEKQKQKLARKELLKKTHKQYPAGTEHTLNIVNQHKEQVSARNAKIEKFSKTRMRLSAEEMNKFIIAGELDSYMDDQIKKTHIMPSVRIGVMVKKYDRNFMYKLTPEYVARNYTEVKNEMDKIICIAKNIEIGGITPQFIESVNGSAIQYDFIEFANVCKDMYKNALLANGLKLNEENGELIAATKEEQAEIKSLNATSVYKMKKMFSINKQNIEDDYLKYQDFYIKTEQEMERLHKAGKDTTQIEALLFKVRDELEIIKAIRNNYNNPENLTKEQREYANMHYFIQDKAYKDEMMTNVCLLRVIEEGVKEEETNIEATRREINILADTINSNMSIEELGEHREDLYRLAAVIIKDGISSYTDTAINELKVVKLLFLERKLRAADILAGVRTDSITLDDLTEQERNSIINNAHGDVTELDIAEHAKKISVLAKKQYEWSMNKYILSESAFELSLQRGNDKYKNKEIADKSNHKNVSSKIIEYSKEYYDLQNNDLKKMYNDLKIKLNEMISVKEKADDSVQIEKEIDQIKEKMTYIQILYRLKREKYSVYGDDNPPYVAPVFRGVSNYENDEFADMSDEEFLNMSKKLSAGTFENDVDEDTKERYVKENMDGLKILKEKSIARYKRLHEKYGLRVIDIDYIQEHYYEIKKDFSFTQDDEQQHAIKGVLDLKSNNDIMLLHLVKFYSDIAYIAMAVLNTTITAQSGYDDYKQKLNSKWNESTNEHYVYIKEHEGDILKL